MNRMTDAGLGLDELKTPVSLGGSRGIGEDESGVKVIAYMVYDVDDC